MKSNACLHNLGPCLFSVVCGHYVFAMPFRNFKPTPNMLSFLEKADLLWKIALLPNSAKKDIGMLGLYSPKSNLTDDTKQEV